MSSLPVTAIIVSYNSGHVLAACLDALKKAQVTPLVVDNASTDNTVEICRNAQVQVIVNARNEGYGRANNTGAKCAETEYLLFINPDAVVDENTLPALLQAAEETQHPTLFAPVLEEPDGRLCEEKHGPLGMFLSGACLLVKKQVFWEMGGFDPEIFLFYEDDDLSRRFRDKGFHLQLVKNARVRHIRGGSSQPAPKEEAHRRHYLVRYHQAWSYFYICTKYGIKAKWLSWMLLYSAKYLVAFISRNPQRIARFKGSLQGARDYAKGKRAVVTQGLE